jgi:hypothetical protein
LQEVKYKVETKMKQEKKEAKYKAETEMKQKKKGALA